MASASACVVVLSSQFLMLKNSATEYLSNGEIGFRLQGRSYLPFYQVVDFVYGETTCDAKKKTWELLDEYVPTHVMEIPQMKRERDKRLWVEEVKDFKVVIEEKTGKEVTEAELKISIETMNAKRKAMQRLNSLRHHNPSPISGRDMLLVQQIAFYDIPERFTKKVNDSAQSLRPALLKKILSLQKGRLA